MPMSQPDKAVQSQGTFGYLEPAVPTPELNAFMEP